MYIWPSYCSHVLIRKRQCRIATIGIPILDFLLSQYWLHTFYANQCCTTRIQTNCIYFMWQYAVKCVHIHILEYANFWKVWSMCNINTYYAKYATHYCKAISLAAWNTFQTICICASLMFIYNRIPIAICVLVLIYLRHIKHIVHQSVLNYRKPMCENIAWKYIYQHYCDGNIGFGVTYIIMNIIYS